MIKAVDSFVFYDDVNYIKGGWINRNRILINGEAQYFTVPLIKASPNRQINDILIKNEIEFSKLLKTLENAYKKAPYFETVFGLMTNIWTKQNVTIADLAIESCKVISNYLKLDTKFYISSKDFADTKGLERSERLKIICRQLETNQYINAIGGMDLYSKEDFMHANIQLSFIKSLPIEYKQFHNDFVPWLSIVDVMMFNSVEEINMMLDQYELV